MKGEGSRIARIKIWILGLTVSGALLSAVLSGFPFAAGILAGGGLVFLNFLGTERTVGMLAGARGGARWPVLLLNGGKLAFTAAVIALVLKAEAVSPYALLLGVSALPAAVFCDFLVFPVRDGRGKEGT